MRKIFFLLIIQIIAFAAYTQTQCGSTNIAQGKTVTASTDPYSLKTNIVDGNVSTNWYVATTGDQWLYVDLGQQYVVCKAIVKWTLWSYLTSFKIQYSNTANNDWVDLANINGNPVMSGDNQYQYHDVPISNAPAARYIRLLLPAMVQNLDFAETILEMAGLPIPADMQGKSLVPLLRGKQKGNVHDALYYHFYENQEHKVAKHIGVRTDRYKLIYFYEKNEWEMYDLQKDKNEMRNIYNDPSYSKVQKMMKEKLDEMQKQYRDPLE